MKSTETTPCLRNNREILVIGDPESKRTDYFSRAAAALGVSVRFVEWRQVREQKLAPSLFVKIDPPAGTGARVDDLAEFARWYGRELEFLKAQTDIRFLNTPQAVLDTFDKLACKKRLEEFQIAVTARIEESVSSYEELKAVVKAEGRKGVFIKPRFGSGAAGILAYRYHRGRQEEIAYTSMVLREDGGLYNTKRLRRITDGKTIAAMTDRLLKLPVILERWEHKAQISGLSFDIRAVWQFDRLDYLVARGSKGPITNLHLNNGAISIDQIGLTRAQLDELEILCRNTASCFPGLSSAGIDILMTPKGRFKVIEVNGQGDLIYQDIYENNGIYKRQIQEGVKRYGGDSQ